jgi:hypothetical protein
MMGIDTDLIKHVTGASDDDIGGVSFLLESKQGRNVL